MVPPKIIHFNKVFPCKPSIFWGTPIFGNTQVLFHTMFFPCFSALRIQDRNFNPHRERRAGLRCGGRKTGRHRGGLRRGRAANLDSKLSLTSKYGNIVG